MKKILALILAALLIFCMVACGQSNEQDTAEENLDEVKSEISVASGKFVYSANDSGDYEIIDYIPSGVKVIELLELPKTTADKREITGIANDAFKADLTIKAVKIPETYTYIGDFAFYDCDNLESVTMTSSVVSAGKYSFAECDKLASLELSDSISAISEGMFKNCVSLTSVSVPKLAAEICDSAFLGCKALSVITLPSELSKITKNAFYGCDALTYTVDGNAKYLGNTDNPHLALISALDLNIEECTANKNTVLVADNAFANCKYLEKLVLGEAVTYISNTAVTGCESLEYNEFENARYIGNTKTPYAVMISVINLSHETLKLHADTRIITAEAFKNCIKLEAISYDKTSSDWNSIIKTENWNHEINITVICNGDTQAN